MIKVWRPRISDILSESKTNRGIFKIVPGVKHGRHYDTQCLFYVLYIGMKMPTILDYEYFILFFFCSISL